ncbi:MAG: right-handed parallel beta-helix repeat-containing protein [Kiritimatiellae bacterium]|nr:right-handed parallel beta-helix repeat-containing protein [Kiritimatiellia bacterium]
MRMKIFTCAAIAACALFGGEVEWKRGKHAVLPADAFTVAIDVQPEAVRNGGIPGMVAWFGNGWDYGFRLRMSPKDYGFMPSLEISKGKRNGSYVLEARDAIMPAGLKTHLAATWDGQTARIYVNGKCVAEDRHEKPLVRANGLNWGVGGPSYGLWGYPFATSGVRLWDSALSAAEVSELAKRVPVVPEAEVAAFVGQPINACVRQILAGTVDPRFEGLAKQRVFNAIFSGRDLQLSRELLCSFVGSVTNLGTAVAQDFRLRLASAAVWEKDVAGAEKEYAALWNDACAAEAVYAPIAGLAYANVLARKGDQAKAAEVRAAAAARARPFLKPECSGEGVPPASTCVEPLPGRPAVEIHVAPNGNEDGDGSAAKPFASLVRARDAVRALKKAGPLPAGGVAVCLHGGVYRLSETLELGAEDSGEPGAPIVWRAWKDERPVLTGALDVPRFDAPLDPEVVRRLSPEARGHVVCADVRALGYTDTSPLHAFGFHRGEVGGGRPITDVYADAERLTLARFPNEGWLHIGEILDDSTNRVFKADIDLTPWADEPSLMLTGFWRHYWADLTEAPEKLDPATGLVTLGKRFNMVIQSKRPWFIVNAIHALDRPGEWWLDRPNGKLYLWPPKDARRFAMSLFDKPFFSLNGVRHFAVAGLVMERGRSAAVMARNCGDFHFTGNVVRDFGGEGVVLKNVRNASVCGNVLRGFGLGALRISGGDRKTLTASGVVVSDNDISWVERWKRTYAPGLHLDGCGTEVVHNHFHDMLSSAMRIEGNDHHVVSNIVERVVTESDDQGGIDIYANPSYAGIYIAFNVWRDIGCGGENAPCGQAGVRFDDAVSSMTVYCNYFENCSFSRFGCVQMNGGRNNTIDNNLFVNSPKGVSAGQWGQDRWHAYFKRPNVVRWTEEETSIRKPPYSEKYPGIAQLPEMGPVNYLTRNVVVGPGRLFTGSPQTVTYANRSFDDMPSAERLAEEPSFRPLPPESALGPRDVPSYRRACANMGCVQKTRESP